MINNPVIREQVLLAIHETIKDLHNISSVFRNPNYDLDKVVENELDFILGVVLSRIVYNVTSSLIKRNIRPNRDEIHQINQYIFSQAERLKEEIRKTIGV